TAPDAVVQVLLGGRPLATFRASAAGATAMWKGKAGHAGGSTGFLMDVDAGPHAYEIRVSGPPNGAAILLVAADKARRPLAAGALVVPAHAAAAVAVATPPPTPRPGATPIAIARATPRPQPTPQGPSLDSISTRGGRAV